MIQNNVLNSSYFMLLGRPWLRDVKVFHDWGNNTITIQGMSIIKTIPITEKLRAPTKHPKVLVCYDFHSRISNEKEDLMFVTKPKLFSIGTIVILTSVWLDQLVKLTTSRCLNLVEHVYVPIEFLFVLPISSDIPVKPIFILFIKIAILTRSQVTCWTQVGSKSIKQRKLFGTRGTLPTLSTKGGRGAC